MMSVSRFVGGFADIFFPSHRAAKALLSRSDDKDERSSNYTLTKTLQPSLIK